MTRRQALATTAGAFLSLALPARSSSSCRLFPPKGVDAYTVLRNGEPVGRHSIAFTREDGNFLARVETEVRYAVGGASEYRYSHHSEETWKDAWLHALVSDTREGGSLWRVRAYRDDNVFKVKTNRFRLDQHISGYLIPSSLWHRDTAFESTLFDTIEGRLKRVQTRLFDDEQMSVRGKPVVAKHLVMWGELQRELWYAQDCMLVRAEVLAHGGTWLTLQLE
jgi:hypothetical protein